MSDMAIPRTPPPLEETQAIGEPPARHEAAAASSQNDDDNDEQGAAEPPIRDAAASGFVSQRQRQQHQDSDEPERSASANIQMLEAENAYLMQQVRELSENMARMQSVQESIERPTPAPPAASQYRTPATQVQPRAQTHDSSATLGAAPYRPKVTDLHNKLNDGASIRPSLWRTLMLERLEIYQHALPTESFRRQYVLEQTQGLALEYLEGQYLQQTPPLTAVQLVESVATFLTDPAEAQRAADEYYVLRMGNLSFTEFHRQLMRLANLAGITDKRTLRQDLTFKVTEFYRRATGMGRMASTSLEGDVRVYQWLEANEAGIKTVNAARSNTPANTTRRTQGESHSTSRTELAAQAKQPAPHAYVSTNPRLGTPAPAVNDTPRHFTPARNSPAFQQSSTQRHATPPGNYSTDRARSHTVGAVEYTEADDDAETFVDAPEDPTPAEAEAIAHAVHAEMDRAKDDA
jgi:hypothetical protein